MDELELKNIIEVLLISSSEPLSFDKLVQVFDEQQKPDKKQVQKVIDSLKTDYAARSFDIIEVASGFFIQTRKEYSTWINGLRLEKPPKYSRALLEILAIIAYKQPVTRADIEDLRGVAVSSNLIKTLLEREWIRIAGYKDVAGKPAVYTTTKEFLNYFNLKNLDELPVIPEVLETLTLNNECISE